MERRSAELERPRARGLGELRPDNEEVGRRASAPQRPHSHVPRRGASPPLAADLPRHRPGNRRGGRPEQRPRSGGGRGRRRARRRRAGSHSRDGIRGRLRPRDQPRHPDDLGGARDVLQRRSLPDSGVHVRDPRVLRAPPTRGGRDRQDPALRARGRPPDRPDRHRGSRSQPPAAVHAARRRRTGRRPVSTRSSRSSGSTGRPWSSADPPSSRFASSDEYLDENFYTHKEDHDISWRLRLAGWECWYVPRAVAYHARTTRGLGVDGVPLSGSRRSTATSIEKSTARADQCDEEPVADARQERGRLRTSSATCRSSSVRELDLVVGHRLRFRSEIARGRSR